MAGGLYLSTKLRTFTETDARGVHETKPAMQHATFTVVAEYGSLAEAEIAKSILLNAGIRAEIRNEYMTSLSSVAMPAQVVVREEDAFEAREALQRMR